MRKTSASPFSALAVALLAGVVAAAPAGAGEAAGVAEGGGGPDPGAPSPAAGLDSARALLEQGAAAAAREAFERLALAGDPQAQNTLARMLVAGVGGPADRGEAMGWFCVLAHQPAGGAEVVQALWLLAEYFRTGGGLPGYRYDEGRRDRENPLRAHFWFTLLATQERHYEQVVEDAARLGALGVRSTARQLLEAERVRVAERAQRWRPRPQPARPARQRCLALPE